MKLWCAMLPMLTCGGCALITATPPHVEVATVQLRGVGILNAEMQLGLCGSN